MELIKRYLRKIFDRGIRGLNVDQARFVQTDADWKLMVANRGAGKTTAAMREARIAMKENPGARVLIISATEASKKYHAGVLARDVESAGMAITSFNSSFMALDNGSRAEYISAANLHINALRGRRGFDLVVVDDAESIREEMITEIKIITTRTRLVMTATPLNDTTIDMLNIGMKYVQDDSYPEAAYAF
jgi:hypothetical protein